MMSRSPRPVTTKTEENQMPQKLLRDDVALWLNTASLEAAITAARDMRSCTRTVVITQNFF